METVTVQSSYGEPDTGYSEVYLKAAEFLKDCKTVEDWGCGRGWFRQFFSPEVYRGIDVGVDSCAAENVFVDEYANLSTYTSSCEGIFLRGVLEHNFNWRDILNNAVASFTRKLCIVIFTPFSEEEHAIAVYQPPEYPDKLWPTPDMSLEWDGFVAHFDQFDWVCERVHNNSQYGEEVLFYISRPVREGI